MRRLSCAATVCAAIVLVTPPRTHAAGTWFEITSPHFQVWAEANNGATRTLVWQLEQIRHVAKTLWPWMKVDLPKPLVILAVKDERSMRTIAPQYWEGRDGVRPVSVWVTAPQQNYIAIRTDIQARDDGQVNPHTSAYFSYADLAVTTSFARAMPLWVSRGLAGVLSNTLVRKDEVLIGAPIPWHLESLRARRVPLRQMLAVTRSSPEIRTADGLRYFDAQSWAFVHYLMFSDRGASASKLNAFIERVDQGEAPDAVFASVLGTIDDHERGFDSYVNRRVYSIVRAKGDVGLDRERFPARSMTPAETTLAQAAFHVAMRRPAEARTLLNEAAKTDPSSPGASVLEALMMEAGGDADGARAAYARAVELGTTDPYALYRHAVLSWRGADAATLDAIEKQLALAVDVRPLFAAAHAALAEVRADLKRPHLSIAAHMQKAVALEPSNPWHRLAAARILARLNVVDEARKAAQSALALADQDPAARAEAERILALLESRQD
jgi:Flp pilus assembly protein TadD